LESSFSSRAIFCLQEKKSETAIELRYLAKESKATYSCTQRSREKQLRDLMDQCTLVEDELAIEQRATTMQQEFLQRKLAALSEKSLDVQTKNDKDSNDKTKLLEQLTEEQTVNKERLFDLEKKYQYDVNTRAAKAEEERRMLELQVSACACVFVSTFCVCRRA
jgi:beta-xylosidase